MLPPWRSPIARAIHRNRSLAYARYFQLATSDPHQRPTNRTVVFRGWLDPESYLQVIIDRRSAKAMNLLAGASDWAEACWYFPETREQFRIAGSLILVTADRASERHERARQQVWQQLSDSGRIQFAWPPPGAARSQATDAFSPPTPDPTRPLDNFCLLLLSPTTVDHLELKGAPQNRDRYQLVAGEWDQQAINP